MKYQDAIKKFEKFSEEEKLIFIDLIYGYLDTINNVEYFEKALSITKIISEKKTEIIGIKEVIRHERSLSVKK